MGDRVAVPLAFVRRVTVREYSEALTVDVVRGIGFQADDGAGWRGPLRRSRAAAKLDAWAHNHPEQLAAASSTTGLARSQ